MPGPKPPPNPPTPPPPQPTHPRRPPSPAPAGPPAPPNPRSTPAQPPRTVYLGDEYVNSRTLSDVTFSVEGRPFYAHRIALLASSDAFRAMFGGGYREKEAALIEIPNIPYDVFEVMMRYIYTGQVGGAGSEGGAGADQVAGPPAGRGARAERLKGAGKVGMRRLPLAHGARSTRVGAEPPPPPSAGSARLLTITRTPNLLPARPTPRLMPSPTPQSTVPPLPQ